MFKDSGNSSTHSLFDFSHRSFIETKKEEINSLIKYLDSIINRL